MAWREGASVDVRLERLSWCLDNAKSEPRKLFVIIKEPPPPDNPNVVVYRSSPGWGDEWEGKSLPNVFFQEDWRENEPLEDFLSLVVQAWQSLQANRYSANRVLSQQALPELSSASSERFARSLQLQFDSSSPLYKSFDLQ